MATAARRDPLASFNFIVDIEGIRVGFAEISGLTNESNPIDYREGSEGNIVRKLPGLLKFGNLMFKRGYTQNGKDLWEWRKSVIEGRTIRMSGTITLRNEAQQGVLVWRFFEAWPVKWAGPAFNAKNSEVALEELEIVHEGIELE